MATTILLTPENLIAEAGKLMANKNTLDDIFKGMADLINNLVSHWHGETQQAFTESFTQKRAIFDDFSDDMASFSNFMKKYANEMEQLEQGNKVIAQKL